MSDPYAPARIHRTNLAFLTCLAAIALSGLVIYPAGLLKPWLCTPGPSRVPAAGLAAAIILLTAALALRRRERGLAFERTALAMPLLLIRSKWCLLLGGVLLFSLATEAVMDDAADGSAPSPFRLRMLAGATGCTLGWLLVLAFEGVTRTTGWYHAFGLMWLTAPGAFLFFLGGSYEWMHALLGSSEELTLPHWGSLGALLSSIMLYAVT